MWNSRITFLRRRTELSGLLLTLALVVALLAAVTRGKLLDPRSVEAMAFQMPLLGLLTLAQMLPMLTGGIDLSVISTANLSGILAAMVLTQAQSWFATPVGVAAGLTGAGLAGLLNGVIVARLGVSPIIGTLATMILMRGLALAITRGYVIAGFPHEFLLLGGGSVLGIPTPFVVFAAATGGMAVVLNRTPFGVSAYMLGSNPVATRFSGIDTRAMLLRTYLISGLVSGLAGLVMISRFNAAQADFGTSFLLLTVLICVLGGVDPSGGVGTVMGLVIAVLILQVVATGFNLVGLSAHLANALWGAILIGVIIYRRAITAVGAAR